MSTDTWVDPSMLTASSRKNKMSSNWLFATRCLRVDDLEKASASVKTFCTRED
jgi:hypothetical protein